GHWGVGAWRGSGASESMLFEPTIEGTAAKAERFGRFLGVASATRKHFANQETLNFLEAHFFKTRFDAFTRAQAEVRDLNHIALGHEDGAFDDVVELAHVAGPGMIRERLQSRRSERLETFAVMPGMFAQEVCGEQGDVLPPRAQRGHMNLDGVESKQQILPE